VFTGEEPLGRAAKERDAHAFARAVFEQRYLPRNREEAVEFARKLGLFWRKAKEEELDIAKAQELHDKLHQLFSIVQPSNAMDIVKQHSDVIASLILGGIVHDTVDYLDLLSEQLRHQRLMSILIERLDECFVYDAASLLHFVYPGKVLELGCGEGLLLKLLANTGCYEAIGLDISEKAITVCLHNDLSIIECDIENGLPFDDDSFDSCISMHCLEHLDDPRKVAEESWRVARKTAAHLIPLGRRHCSFHKHRFDSIEDVIGFFEGWEVTEVPETKCAIIYRGQPKEEFPTPLEIVISRRRRERKQQSEEQ